MLRLDDRTNHWRRLEDLLGRLKLRSLSGLSRAEVREFGELYRRTAADLAVARAESRDPKLVSYLNSLVIRAHGEIYRAESRGLKTVSDFFVRDFPKAFRRNLRPILFAFLIFASCATASFIASYRDMSFADALGVSDVAFDARTDTRWWLRLNDANQIGSSRILTNNILVASKAFAYGALLGIGTVWVLAMNGLMIGGVLGVCYGVNPEFGTALVTFMVGHGVIELSCIFIAGGAGMRLGYSIIDPGDLTRVEALKESGIEAVKLALGCSALLVVAGLIEGFISPSGAGDALKFGVGIISGVAMYTYLFLSGRQEAPAPPTDGQSIPRSLTRR